MTLIQKEVMHHILSVRFVALLLMCLFARSTDPFHQLPKLSPKNLVDYQEAIKLANIEETTMNPGMPLDPEVEVSKTLPQTDSLERLRKWIGRCNCRVILA